MDFYKKLDEYISRYYKNKLLKGILFFVFAVGLAFLAVNFLEYWLFLPKFVRFSLLIVFILIMFVFLITNIIVPILKVLNISKRLDYKSAEKLIRKQFPEIKDQLLNLLELDEMKFKISSDLCNAAIQQKINNLSVYNFIFGIHFKENLKYLKWTLIPVVAIVLFLLINPEIITAPAGRIVHYNQYFEKPSPFNFAVLNDKLEVVQNEDFELKIKSIGEEIPEELYVKVGDMRFKMHKDSRNEFSYIFKNVYQNIDFQLQSIDYLSKFFVLQILVKPIVLDIKIFITPPVYTGLNPYTVENSGNVQAAEGAAVKLQIQTKNVDTLMAVFDEFGTFRFRGSELPTNSDAKISVLRMQKSSNTQHHVFNWKAKDDLEYYLIPKNKNVINSDTINYTFTVIKDQYPRIAVEEFKDSINKDFFYFSGQISDDYGFSNLIFTVEKISNERIDTQYFNVNFSNKDLQQNFLYSFDLRNVGIHFGEKIDYYFKVSDNDGVNGSKSTFSKRFSYYQKSEEELQKEVNEQGKDIVNAMLDNMRQLEQNNKAVDNLLKEIIDKKDISWDVYKKFDDILDKQRNLMNQHEAMKDKLQEMFQNRQKLSQEEERLLEKQQLMQELYDKVMTEEMRKTLEELQQLMQQQMSKDEMQKKMEQIKLNNKEIEKQLDQNLEIFKKMEIERKFSDIVSQLEELKQKQEELRSQLSDNQNITEEQKKKQDSINKAFDEIKKDLEQAKKENQNLENPIRINTAEDKQQQAEKSLEQAMQQMQNGNSKQAKSSQKEAEDAMEEMAEALQNSMSESEKEENKEDAEMIKRLLKNIVIVSKQQENIEEEMKNITVNNKRYPVLLKEQQSLNKNIRHISDSLYALGKRQAAVANVINQELKNMEHYSNDVMSDLLAMNTVFVSGYKNNSAIRNQQLLMTSLNNVAVLLAESLDKMDKQNMSGSGKGSKSGKKKSGGENSTGKSSAQSARELQEQLNKQLEQMKQQMGKQEGGQKGQASMSEQLARSAAQQEAVRKMMQDAMNEMKAQGLKPSNDMQKILDDMEKTEKELVNKIVNQNTLKRQQDILTRLLEHEKAELKREQEERRQSQEAKQQNFKVPEEVIKKQQNSQQEIENIRKIQPVLRPFYKQEVQRYFEN